MKRVIRIILRVVLSIVVVLLVLPALCYIPAIQRFAKDKAAQILSEQTGWDVAVGRFDLRFPLKLQLSGVSAVTAEGDTLLSLEQVRTGVALMPLLKGKVMVGEFRLTGLSTDMTGLIDGLDLTGHVGEFVVRDIDVSLSRSTGVVKSIALNDADIYMRMTETAPDTTAASEPLPWSFRIEQLDISNTSYALDMPESQLDLSLMIGSGAMREADLSLADNVYQVGSLEIGNSFYSMNLDSEPVIEGGLDPSHIALRDVNLAVDSIYNCGSTVRADIRSASFRERSGLILSSLSGSYRMDSLMMELGNMKLITPNSQIIADARIDQSIFETPRRGSVRAMIDGRVGKQDVLYFVTPYAPAAEEYYPDEALTMRANVSGDMQSLDISEVLMELPTAFSIGGAGYVKQLSNEKRTSADVTLDINLEDLGFVTHLLPDTLIQDQVKIPCDIYGGAHLVADAGQYRGSMNLAFDRSRLDLRGHFVPTLEQYGALLEVDSLALDRFLPASGLGLLTMEAKAQGKGYDPYSPNTVVDAEVRVDRCDIGKYRLADLALDASLRKSLYDICLIGKDSILNADVDLSGLFTEQQITADLRAAIGSIDFYRLGLTESDMLIAGTIDARAHTDMKQVYYLKGQIADFRLREDGKLMNLGNIDMLGDLSADSTRVAVTAGDLDLHFDAEAGLDGLMAAVDKCQRAFDRQFKERRIDVGEYPLLLPDMVMQFSAGQQNALYKYIQQMGIGFDAANLLMAVEEHKGITVAGSIDNLKQDTTLYNNIGLSIMQTGSVLDYQVNVLKKSADPMRTMNAQASGAIEPDKMSLDVIYKNGNDQIAFDLGAQLDALPNELRLHFRPYDPVLFYRKWSINDNNFIALAPNKHIFADFDLMGEKGFELGIHSGDTIPEVGHNDLDLTIKRFDLAPISQFMPDFPTFSGMINADACVTFDEDQMAANGTVRIDTFYFDNKRLGDLKLAANYEMTHEIGQYAYASLDLDSVKVLEADVALNDKDSIPMSANVFAYAFPLKLANPFVPDAMASLVGTTSGEIKMQEVKGQPLINGKIDLDSAAVTVNAANATFRLEERPLTIDRNVLRFDNFSVLACNKNPLLVNGTFNFTDFNRMRSDLRITGSNVELINSPKKKGQMIYGKLMMDLNTTVTGPLELLTVKGSVSLLTGTKINYVMLDSPVSAQNRVSSLVTFTNFNDTIADLQALEQKTASFSGINMLMTINIASTTDVGIDLSTDGSDRVELKGGGNLSFHMTPMGSTDLSGRYTLTGGLVRYNLPVLPVAKTFNIRNGSYVEWTGQLMDPYINIQASETVRTTVSENGSSRAVTFEPYISITNRLDNLNVAFSVDVQNDPTIQSQIAQMTAEERSRQAMNLIIMQTYTGPGVSTKTTANSMLNAFIQKEINSFAGSALKGVDVSVGIDTYDQAGADRTDYSFRFSKQLFNDRFRIVIGGKVSSGGSNDATDRGDSFIDDVTLEYMLDASGTRYVKLFHHTGYESVLEGQITETGVGAVFQRRVRKLRQLFIFNEEKRRKAIAVETDSVPQPKKEPEVEEPKPEAAEPNSEASEPKPEAAEQESEK